MSYYDLWAILGSWRREFSSTEFAWTFASPDPRKVLHDMVGKGLLERLERGKYRVRSAGEYARAENDVSSGYELLSTATMTYALTGVDGVFVWTRGGYNAGRFFGFYPIHLKVFARDLPRWRSFFHKAGKNAFIAERKPERTLFGVFYLLYPSTRIKAETVNMLRVEPLTKTLQFCRNNIYTFEPALEMLTQQYRNSTKAAA
ncbi:hypothetical protein E6H19_10515 [Candidatus Bathyarchaeota archaeon]|nr:MAG: hypothetical protein E6H30_04150 [Candidatus Bathyarchaeota archaeon]TMI43130.1 MAG: hypothetical protein E6H19_10515 [Candidatus Bathyarchaeota archaeon]